MEFWKLNEDRRIVALEYYTINGGVVNAGSIGARIPKSVTLPLTTDRLWVAYNATISDNVTLNRDTYIADLAAVHNSAVIGKSCIVNNRATIGPNVKLPSGTVVGAGEYIVDEAPPKDLIKESASMEPMSEKSTGMEFWRIDSDNRLIASRDFELYGFKIRAGDVGPYLASSVNLPSRTDRLWISPKASIGLNVEIGADTYIADYATVHDNVIIGRYCFIKAAATVRESTKLEPWSQISKGETVGTSHKPQGLIHKLATCKHVLTMPMSREDNSSVEKTSISIPISIETMAHLATLCSFTNQSLSELLAALAADAILDLGKVE